ncbi:MAG: GGDEF domain-containing protein [Cyanobacteria bacterium P01_F01_bin.42]
MDCGNRDRLVTGKSLVCRYGTLTFAILLPDQTQSDGEPIAAALMKATKNITVPKDHPTLTLSIGITSLQPTAETGIEEFLEAGDRNLSQAIEQGGNRVGS